MADKKYPRIRYYEPVWTEGEDKPSHYMLDVENDRLPLVHLTPDYDTWKGEWVYLEEIKPEDMQYRIQREHPPLGYSYVMFVEPNEEDPTAMGKVVYEIFMPTAPTPGHLLNIEGKFYDIVDCTWTIDTDQYGTVAECYLMVEVVLVGDAEKLIQRQKDNEAAIERRNSFIVHDFSKTENKGDEE